MTYATINTNLEAPPFKIPLYDAPGVMNSTWVRWFQGLWDRVGGPSGSSLYDVIKAGQLTSATEPQLMGQFEDIRQELTGVLLSIIEQVQEQFFDPSALISDVNLQIPNLDALAFEENGLGYILSIAREAVSLDDVLRSGNTSDLSMQTGDHTVNGVLDAQLVISPIISAGDIFATTVTSNLYIGTGTQLTDLQTTALSGDLQIINFNSGTNASSSTYWMGDGVWRELPSPVFIEAITTATQTLSAVTATEIVSFNTVTNCGCITLENGNEIHLNQLGVYNVQVSTQFINIDNNTTRRALNWFRKNGTDVPESARVISVSGRHSGLDGSAVLSYNTLIESTNTNDYFQLVWNAESTNVSIQSFGPSTTAPVYPRAPAVILTVSKLRT